MTMTAKQVCDALAARYPDDQYLRILEAPMHSDRSGRKLDMVVIALWKSRGLSIDGIEVKVSMSDFRRELKEPEKADWWWHRCNRFWIACPASIADKVLVELPEAWGLLACTEKGVRVRKPAPAKPASERLPIEWPTLVGMFRASANAGVQALWDAEARGRRLERERIEADAVASNPELQRRIDHLEREAQGLRDAIDAFEDASGLSLRASRWSHDGERIGRLVQIVTEAMRQGPDVILDRLDAQAQQLTGIAEQVGYVRAGLAAAFNPDTDTKEHVA